MTDRGIRGGCVCLIGLALCCVASYGLGRVRGREDATAAFEALLVDDPSGTAAIRSAVLFERAAAEARRGKTRTCGTASRGGRVDTEGCNGSGLAPLGDGIKGVRRCLGCDRCRGRREPQLAVPQDAPAPRSSAVFYVEVISPSGAGWIRLDHPFPDPDSATAWANRLLRHGVFYRLRSVESRSAGTAYSPRLPDPESGR